VPEAATPTGVLTVVKGLGLAAYRTTANDSNPAIDRAIFVLGGMVFIVEFAFFGEGESFVKEKT